MARIAASPGLRIGVPVSTPKTPTLVIVAVPPDRSAGCVRPSRAVATRSPSAAARSCSESPSAPLMLGTSSPRGVAAAMPRLTCGCRTISWADWSQLALASPCRRSTRQKALATSSSGVTLTSAKARSRLSRSTSSIIAVTSAVTNSVTCGAVKAEATIASAVALRTPLIGTRTSTAGVPSRVPPIPEEGAPRPSRRAEAAPTTSARVTIPPSPVGVTDCRSTPRSLASLRTGGLARARVCAPLAP